MFNHSIFTSAVSPAAERIRFILGEEDDSPAPPQLFTELDELLAVDGQEMEWKETARWGMADCAGPTWGNRDGARDWSVYPIL